MSLPPIALRNAGFFTVHTIAQCVGVVPATARKWFEQPGENGHPRPLAGIVDMPAGSQQHRYYIPEKVVREVLTHMAFPAELIDDLITRGREHTNGAPPESPPVKKPPRRSRRISNKKQPSVAARKRARKAQGAAA